jgi:hypothetical protein
MWLSQVCSASSHAPSEEEKFSEAGGDRLPRWPYLEGDKIG